ncbi:hypothetical protein DFJ77DRAFT_466673 [Powellomyces hirtus]|nr:hypothetical protein DFJ77DRAFT_466673 [Powellomyces hirtus]
MQHFRALARPGFLPRLSTTTQLFVAASYHHSREIQLPKDVANPNQRHTAKSPASAMVTETADVNMFPHTDTDASGSLPEAPAEQRAPRLDTSAPPITEVSNLSADEIRQMAGLESDSSSSSSPWTDRARITSQFELPPRTAPKSTSPRSLESEFLNTNNTNAEATSTEAIIKQQNKGTGMPEEGVRALGFNPPTLPADMPSDRLEGETMAQQAVRILDNYAKEYGVKKHRK